MNSERTALIALGSNLGDSVALLNSAFDRLRQLSDESIQVSSLWQTTPVDCPPDSPRFVNAAVALVTLPGETPESLLNKLQAIEKEFGRQPKVILNEPRPLDLDLIAFGNELRSTPELILPHPRAHLRRFVLQPLSEVAPEFVLPGQTKTIGRLLESLRSSERLTRL